jgi:3-oxoacyl-[acyl-carrier-protein] synthase-3
MTNAAITGWGKCMPPAVLSNADLSTFLALLNFKWVERHAG